MKTIQKNWGGEFPYEAPSVELIEVAVEQGFATSPGSETEEGYSADGNWD